MNKYKRLYKSEFTQIGIIRRSHGYKGHAKISLEESYTDDIKKQQFVFIEIDGYKVPFKIEELSNDRHVIIKLKGCDSSEEMNKYQLHSLHLLKDEIEIRTEEPLSKPSNLIDMKIIDSELGDIGTIIRIDEYPQQKMAVILDSNGK